MRSTAALLCALLVSACISAPRISPGATRDGQRLTPREGMARIYVSRPTSFGAARAWQVFVDGKLIGLLPANASIFLDVEPGSHTVTGVLGGYANATVQAVAGETTFLRVTAGGNFAETDREHGVVNVRTNAIVLPLGYVEAP